jgi:hypothetical protein
LGKSFFANSSGLGCWESSGLLAKPQFPVVNLKIFEDSRVKDFYPISQLAGSEPCDAGNDREPLPKLPQLHVWLFLMVAVEFPQALKIASAGCGNPPSGNKLG